MFDIHDLSSSNFISVSYVGIIKTFSKKNVNKKSVLTPHSNINLRNFVVYSTTEWCNYTDKELERKEN